MWRQGDVLIDTINEMPKGAVPRPGTVLVEGEMTGHTHRIADPKTAEMWEVNGTLYLKVIAATAEIAHDEHKSIRLTKGIYRVWQQREYTPQAIRPVMD
ncbi:MAG: hypothetical protein ACYDEO_03390 [Aggregatilineales bacterium]